LVAPAVQDVVNLRSAEIRNPAIVLPFALVPSGDAAAHMVVGPDDRHASIEVWRAMAAGRPVFHPRGLAYGEQVFWSGMAYAGAVPGDGDFPPARGMPTLAALRAGLVALISV
jgi:hypothetical protein